MTTEELLKLSPIYNRLTSDISALLGVEIDETTEQRLVQILSDGYEEVEAASNGVGLR